MIQFDRDALECDLAETYRIYDMYALPMKKVAILASGLGPDSRIVRAMTEAPFKCDTLLLMTLVDIGKILLWSKAKEGSPKPELITAKIFKKENKKSWTAEEFEMKRKEIIDG